MSFSPASGSVRNPPGSLPARCSHPEITISACLDSGTPLPARLLELARSDVMIITDRPLRFGTPLQLAIFSDLVTAVAQTRAIVHWCRPHSRGWQIGAFLTGPLPDRLTAHEWNDLRDALRYECNWKAWVHWDDGGELEAIRILNYSVNGLRLSTARPVSAGREFSLFGSAGRHDRAVLKGRVQWCRSVDDAFQIGSLIHGQRGRELPRMFGNLAAVHADGQLFGNGPPSESEETLRCEQSRQEQFLAADTISLA